MSAPDDPFLDETELGDMNGAGLNGTHVPPEIIGQGADETLGGDDNARRHVPRFEPPVIPSEPASRAEPYLDKQAPDLDTSTGGEGVALTDRAAEAHVLSCLMLEPAQANLPAEAFYYPEHRLLYLAIQRLHAAGSPVAADTLAAELSDRGQWTTVGEWPFLFGIEKREDIPTTLHLRHYADRVLTLHARRQARQHAEATLAALAEGLALPPAPSPVNPPVTVTSARSPFSFTIPPANDPSILLGNRYLNRGDGMVVSSSSGMGKSSMSNQMAADWALGESFHGIRSNGPLRSLIVQSEDSDGDIAEVWQSLNHVRQWSAEQRATLDANVRIISERALRGVRFIHWLKDQIAQFKPDLVWLNPLQAFIDGDVTDSKDIGFFLREGLNGINRDNKFGYVIIHHTTKPATGKDRHERLWHEQMYDMAGGAEIINWARSIISLRPTEEEGKFKAILAKRGRRAGVVRPVPQGVGERMEPVTTIGLKHATGKLPNGTSIIYWESCDVATEAAPVSRGGGRPPSHHFADYRSVFPKKASIGLPLNQLQRLLDQQRPIKKDALFRALKRWAEDGDVEIVNDPGKSDLYRAAY